MSVSACAWASGRNNRMRLAGEPVTASKGERMKFVERTVSRIPRAGKAVLFVIASLVAASPAHAGGAADRAAPRVAVTGGTIEGQPLAGGVIA